jgi:hypothetical protein
MSAVAVAGTALKSKDAGVEPVVSAAICNVEEPVLPVPAPLCEGSDMHKAVQHDVRSAEPEPVVYGMGDTSSALCTGTAWDPRTIDPNVQGWICYAAVASDKLGNTATSRPLRVCYDNPGVAGAPDCSARPTCTDGCSAPTMDAHLYTVP